MKLRDYWRQSADRPGRRCVLPSVARRALLHAILAEKCEALTPLATSDSESRGHDVVPNPHRCSSSTGVLGAAGLGQARRIVHGNNGAISAALLVTLAAVASGIAYPILAQNLESDWKRYQNHYYRFRFDHPPSLKIHPGVGSAYPGKNYFKRHGIVVVSAVDKQARVTAAMTVSVDDVIANSRECREFVWNGRPLRLVDRQVINGITFHVRHLDTPNVAQTAIYHVLHDGKCYELTTELSVSGHAGSGETDTMRNVLTKMVLSFSFIE